MPRIIVTPDVAEPRLPAPVLLDEHVDFVNLCEDHGAEELIEQDRCREALLARLRCDDDPGHKLVLS